MSMEKAVHRIIITIIVCAVSCSWADASWSTLGGDSTRKGQSTTPGPKRGCLKWVHGAAGPVEQGAVVGAGGEIYFVTSNGVLTALDTDGEMLWECLLGEGELITIEKTDGAIVSATTDYTGDFDALVVSAKIDSAQGVGDLVQFGATKLCIADLDGKEVLSFRLTNDTYGVWGHTAITQGVEVKAVIAAGVMNWQNIQLYIDGKIETDLKAYPTNYFKPEITSVNILAQNAKIKIYKTPEEVVSYPTIGPDGVIYVGFGDKLYAVGADGVIDWDYETEAFIFSCPAVDEEGRIFFGSADGNLYALDSAGVKLWDFEMPGPGQVGGAVLAPPSIGADGSVYIAGVHNSFLYALNPTDGEIRWQCDLSGGEDDTKTMITAPVTADDGTIYATILDDTNLYAIDPNNGEIEWSTDLAHEPELIAHWKFNEPHGTTVHDSSVYERDVVLDYFFYNDFPHKGVLGGAGFKVYFELPLKWNPHTISRTVSTWVKMRHPTLGNGAIVEWNKLGYGERLDNWSIRIRDDNDDGHEGVVEVAINSGFIRGNRDLRDRQWHHIGVVLEDNGSATSIEDVKIFVDGVRDADATYNGGILRGDSIGTGDKELTSLLVLDEYSRLVRDDLRIYTTALDQEQIQQLMWDETAPVFYRLRPVESSIAEDRYSWSEVAIAPDGTIYVGYDDPYLRAINPDGTVKWIKHLARGGNYTLSVGPDNYVYAAGADGAIYVIDPDGRLISNFDAQGHFINVYNVYPHEAPKEVECSLGYPVIGADGDIFIADTGGKVWAISANECDDHPRELTCQQWIMDINNDCIVSLPDFAAIAADWLACIDMGDPCTAPQGPWRYVPGYEYIRGQYLDGDINQDFYVSFDDIAWLMQTWLMGGDIDY